VLVAPRRTPSATTSLTWRGKDRRRSGSRCPSGLITLTASSAAQARVSWRSSKSFSWWCSKFASRQEAVTSSSKPKTRRVQHTTTASEVETKENSRYEEMHLLPEHGCLRPRLGPKPSPPPRREERPVWWQYHLPAYPPPMSRSNTDL
jgi:hypothetical protein